MLAAAAVAQAADLRGLASPGPLGLILFQECRGKESVSSVVKLQDATPDAALTAGLEAVRKIMLEAGRPIYVEFVGSSAANSVKATRFVRAVGTIESCAAALNSMPSGVRLWASGQEPTWQLIVTAREARLERLGESPVRFPAAPFAAAARPAAVRTIDAWSTLDGGTVRVEIAEQMCTDGRSETAYGASVTLRYGSRSYEGCAARF